MLTIGSHIAAGRLALQADLPKKKKGCKCGCAGNCKEKKAFAKLVKASKAMLAGGPGSGRHPEGGTKKDFMNRSGWPKKWTTWNQSREKSYQEFLKSQERQSASEKEEHEEDGEGYDRRYPVEH